MSRYSGYWMAGRQSPWPTVVKAAFRPRPSPLSPMPFCERKPEICRQSPTFLTPTARPLPKSGMQSWTSWMFGLSLSACPIPRPTRRNWVEHRGRFPGPWCARLRRPQNRLMRSPSNRRLSASRRRSERELVRAPTATRSISRRSVRLPSRRARVAVAGGSIAGCLMALRGCFETQRSSRCGAAAAAVAANP